jgi:Ca-activated chloride channel homolog
MNEPGELNLQAGFDRRYVRIRHRSVRYLVVEATAPAAPDREVGDLPPLNLGLVVDASGSMGAQDAGGLGLPLSRLEAAQQASEGVVQNLGETDGLSLVSFSDEAIPHLSSLTLSAEGKETAIAAIASLQTRGSTNLHDGWLEGAEQVAHYMDDHPDCRHRLLLLSDGHANQGITDAGTLAEVAAGLRIRGISSSTVGIGVDYSTEQIEQIAEHGGGMLHHAQYPAEIVEVVLAELKDMRATVIDDLEIGVGTIDGHGGGADGGVGIEVVGLADRPHPNGTSAVLGSLVGNATRRAVFRVFVPPGAADAVLTFRIQASWREAGADGRQAVHTEVSLTRAKDGVVFAEKTDEPIAIEAARVWQADVVKKAIELNRRGHYREAENFTRQQLRYFRRFCRQFAGGEELCASLERTLRRVVRPMVESSRKEIETAMYKRKRGTLDYRSEAPQAWEDYLDE